MARKYRINRDDKVDLKKTQSSFSDDPILNKAKQVSRKDDNINAPKIGIYDIDLAFKSFLENDVKPIIVEDDKFIPVPVTYSTPENWSSAQRDGHMRDSNGKIQAPLITFKRNSLDINTELSKLKVLTDEDTSRTNGTGDERIVRSNMTLTTKAYLIPEHKGHTVNAQKAFGTSKIAWNVKLSS